MSWMMPAGEEAALSSRWPWELSPFDRGAGKTEEALKRAREIGTPDAITFVEMEKMVREKAENE